MALAQPDLLEVTTVLESLGVGRRAQGMGRRAWDLRLTILDFRFWTSVLSLGSWILGLVPCAFCLNLLPQQLHHRPSDISR
jgi:hypothetical protein